jgi:hypothetical protein
MTPADIKLAIHQLEEAIKASTDGEIKVFNLSTNLAEAFIDFLKNIDPDMHRIWRQVLPQPLLPMLGPIVGQEMINTKLERLDRLANDLGTGLMLLNGIVGQLDNIVKKAQR